jgi:glycerol-3-phosphate acyltransferase PlsX
VDGICVIGHGSSKALSVVSALRLAHSAASHGVMDDLHALQGSPGPGSPTAVTTCD